MLLTISTTWEEEEGAVEVEVWLSVTWLVKNPLLIKEASPASVPEWSDRTGGSILEEGEVEVEVHVAHMVVALAGLAMEAVTVARNELTGPLQKIGSNGVYENILDLTHIKIHSLHLNPF